MREAEKVVIVNLTPHDVSILEPEAFLYKGVKPRVRVTYPPAGFVARANYDTTLVENVIDQFGNLVSVTKTRYRISKPLPPPQEGVLYIVSKVIADILYGTRDDLRIVSGKLYDTEGRIIGVRGLSILSKLTRDE